MDLETVCLEWSSNDDARSSFRLATLALTPGGDYIMALRLKPDVNFIRKSLPL
jgi:hypothetical protein